MISIIVPVYNGEKYIENCLLSIKKQTMTEFECICIDDGSVDESKKIIKNFIKNDNRFYYFYQKNSGPSSARNNGIEKASGKYILFVDCDDTISPYYLEKLFLAIEQNKTDICCCGYTCIEEKQNYTHNDYPVMKNPKREDFIKMLFRGTGGTVCSKLFQLEIIRKNNIQFNENFSLCEDQLFALEFYCACKSYLSIECYDYYYNKSTFGISTDNKCEKWYQQLELVSVMEEKMRDYGIHEDIIKECCEIKIKNVMIALAMRSIIKGKDAVKNLLLDPKVVDNLNRVHIRGKSDIKWILPLKLKLFWIIKMVYEK